METTKERNGVIWKFADSNELVDQELRLRDFESTLDQFIIFVEFINIPHFSMKYRYVIYRKCQNHCERKDKDCENEVEESLTSAIGLKVRFEKQILKDDHSYTYITIYNTDEDILYDEIENLHLENLVG